MLGYHAKVTLAGRRIKDSIGKYIAEQTIKQMIQAGSPIKGNKVNVLGITFKEDVPDVRNSKVVDLIPELRTYGVEVFVLDPVADAGEARQKYAMKLMNWEALPHRDALVPAVAHAVLVAKPAKLSAQKLRTAGCFIDVKGVADAHGLRSAGLQVLCL